MWAASHQGQGQVLQEAEKVKIGCGNLYITVNYDDNGICEVFTNTGRTGGCPSQSEATARLVSIALRSGLSTEVLIEQLKGIRCPSTIRQKRLSVTSCPDAIASTIEKVLRESGISSPSTAFTNKAVSNHAPSETKFAKFCPECGGELEHEGGCVTCRNCAYSKCS
jgi:ribonucleoside-diphosphate reductase alpha chain